MPSTVEKFMNENNAQIYDRIRIKSSDKSFEGIILPKHKFSAENILIIKLDNGYNIGISIEDSEMEVISKSKRTKENIPKKKQDKNLPKITILGTGGTIASFVDYKTGAVSPAITTEQLVNSVNALEDIATINAEPLLSLASEDLNPSHWEKMATKVNEIHSNLQQGIVIGHGTDTMSYSAAALSFQLSSISKPVVFTGAQRSPDRPSSDAHLNLIGAAKAAMSDLGEIAIAMHETTDDRNVAIWRGNRVRKAHSSKRNAFSNPNEGVLGLVNEKIHWKSKYRSISEETTLNAGFEEGIAMVWSHPGLKIEDWENITSKKKGIVIAGTGLGHIKSELLDSIKATSKDMPVAMATQCFSGSTNLNVYSNGRELLKRGVVETYDTLPETALVKMMWLSKHHPNDVRELMETNLVGELSNSRKLG